MFVIVAPYSVAKQAHVVGAGQDDRQVADRIALAVEAAREWL